MGQAEQYSFESYDLAQEAYFERGWTDGLPVVPPTPEKVERFLDYAGLGRGDVLGSVPTREVTVTAEQAAINGVMAGCKAEYFPVIVAALRALTEEKGNFHSTTGTLTGAAQTVIINGPIRTEYRYQLQSGVFRPRLAGECHHREGPPAGGPERGPVHSRLPGPGDLFDACALFLLLRRKRRGQSLGAVAGRAGFHAGHQHGNGCFVTSMYPVQGKWRRRPRRPPWIPS